MRPSSNDLALIEEQTLAHYENNAEQFWLGTKDHDVSQNRSALLAALPTGKTLDILDFGCGPGRDLHYFNGLGHHAVGLDGCENFCRMAHEFTGCTVLHQSFLNLTLPPDSFDGIFANASLFHVPGNELLRVLKQLHSALRSGGILFTSNPRGNSEGWSGERYGCWMEFDTSKTFLEQAGFTVLDHYYRPAGLPQQQQPWLAIVSACNK
ncbi:MAG TPA: class I SAM-dependent methyltransferase [Pseudomonadales bacterium]|nr:class I SAM-dependent methyltransferase [Pseudomonadales bacterium]